MKTYITDENGKLIINKLIVLIIGLSIVSYLSSLSWYKPYSKSSIISYINEVNKNCPIEHSDGVFLDSVTYDNKNLITNFISINLIEMDDKDLNQMKNKMIENVTGKMIENKKLNRLIHENEVSIKYRVQNRKNIDQDFEFVINKSSIKRNDH